jgi:2-keto-4-pentenoate hydratase/2-oxohepta-3-ene-1,7-dioic acid hydratase in catechol pathway
MKLVTFKINESGKQTVGAYTDAGYVDLNAQSGGALPADMIELLNGGDAALAKAAEVLAGATAENTYSEDQITQMAPVPRPGKIIHTSCNFDAHLSELTEWQAPEWQEHGWGDFHFEHPTGFLEASSCVVANGEGIRIPRFTKQLDHEIEVGIVIGKTAKCVTPEEALDYVAGLTIFNDVSARDIQAREHANKVILMGKSFDGSCPFGPWLVTKDEIGDVNDLDMELTVNGNTHQKSNMSQTHYNVQQLVSWWSEMTLEPGDIITTGSPPGVISGQENPEWLKPGDVIDCYVEKLGNLVTPIVE